LRNTHEAVARRPRSRRQLTAEFLGELLDLLQVRNQIPGKLAPRRLGQFRLHRFEQGFKLLRDAIDLCRINRVPGERQVVEQSVQMPQLAAAQPELDSAKPVFMHTYTFPG
jgi:hypothetical protein